MLKAKKESRIKKQNDSIKEYEKTTLLLEMRLRKKLESYIYSKNKDLPKKEHITKTSVISQLIDSLPDV